MAMQPFEVALGAAVVLAALEVVTGTFVLLGFCIGCLAVAAVELVSGQFGVGRDVLVFAVVAGAAVVGLRRVFGARGDSRRVKGDVNEY
jgi:membrane protein implicated in regulation of membrane protease activity